MKFQVEKRGNYKFVEVEDLRLDVFSASKLDEELFVVIQNLQSENIVLDISCCCYCDATGLGAIVKLHWMCMKACGMLVVKGIQANVRSLIEICMLQCDLNIARDDHEVELLLKKKGMKEMSNTTIELQPF